MSGEDIAAKVAELEITKVLKAFGATKINPAVAQKAVDGAVTLAGWFQESYAQAVGSKRMVQEFLSRRAALVPLPDPSFKAAVALLGQADFEHSSPWATSYQLSKGFSLKSFASLSAMFLPCLQPRNFTS